MTSEQQTLIIADTYELAMLHCREAGLNWRRVSIVTPGTAFRLRGWQPRPGLHVVRLSTPERRSDRQLDLIAEMDREARARGLL